MYNVSPLSDLEDAVKVEQYIQDRRVIGVRLPTYSFIIVNILTTYRHSTTL